MDNAVLKTPKQLQTDYLTSMSEKSCKVKSSHYFDCLRDPLFFTSYKNLTNHTEPSTDFFAETGVWLAFIGLFLVPLIAIALY